MTFRIGIVGCGNIGHGDETAVAHSRDLESVAIFTRRDPASIKPLPPGLAVVPLVKAASWKDAIDVMILCGGSATDLPTQTPELAQWFNVVDSFDTHARIHEHFAAVDTAAKRATGSVSFR